MVLLNNIRFLEEIERFNPDFILSNNLCIGVEEREIYNLNFQCVTNTREIEFESIIESLFGILLEFFICNFLSFIQLDLGFYLFQLISLLFPIGMQSSILWDDRLFPLTVHLEDHTGTHVSNICRIVREMGFDGGNINAGLKFH